MTSFGRRVWIGAGLLLAYALAYVVVVALPDSLSRPAVPDLMNIGVALGAAILCGVASLKSKDGFVRWFWGLLAIAELCNALAATTWAVYELVLRLTTPYPSFADVAWLCYYPLAFAAVMRLTIARRRRRAAETVSSLDAVLVCLAGAALSWEFLMAPALGQDGTPLTSLTSLAYPLGDLLLLGALASLALSARRRNIPRGTSFVIAAFVLGLVADVAYTRMIIAGTYSTGVWVEPVWALAYAFVGMAALVYVDGRAKGHTVESEVRPSFVNASNGIAGFVHRYIPYTAVLVAGFLSYYHIVVRTGATPIENVVVVLITTLIPIIVLARQLFISMENRHLQDSLIAASQALERRVDERTRELAAEKERLAVLNQASKEISRCTSVGEVLDAGAALLARASHCGSVAVSASGQRGSLRFVCARAVAEAGRRQLRRVLRKFLLSNADNSDDTPFLLADADLLPRGFGAGAEHAGQFTRIMVFPIISRQVMLGAACLASSDPDCELTEGESGLIGNIVSQLAVALESACRYDDARFLADNDALTGLANRHCFSDRLDQEVVRSDRAGLSFALIMMDVDKFKFFNDTYGHVTGDRVLVEAANALREAVRECDILGRYGGDEFVAILPGTDRAGASLVVQRIGGCLADHPVAVDGGTSLSLRLSCGVAVYPNDGLQPESLLRIADAAMYKAKRGNAAPTPSPGTVSLADAGR